MKVIIHQEICFIYSEILLVKDAYMLQIEFVVIPKQLVERENFHEVSFVQTMNGILI